MKNKPEKRPGMAHIKKKNFNTQELKNLSRRILAPVFSGSTLENFLTIAIRTPQRLPSDWGQSQHKHRFIEKCREVGKVKKLQFRGFFF